MSTIPKIPVLGNIVIDEVFEYYDFPRVFTCKNSTGNSYFALSIYDDDDRFEWLYLSISSFRKKAILENKISLHYAITNPEDNFLIKIKSFSDKSKLPEFEYILPEQLSEDDLPSTDYILKSTRTSVILQYENPKLVASASRRETFDYRILPDTDIHEVPARKLGNIIVSTQELIDALGQASTDKPTVRGPIPAELLQKTKINVSQFFQGSFGVQFSADQPSDLFNESTVQSALQELGNLFNAADSERDLSDKLHTLKGRVAAKYAKLLAELVDINSGLKLEWGSVDSQKGGKFSLSQEQIKNASALVERIEIDMAEELIVHGQLIGFNIRTKRFEIEDNNGTRFIGKVDRDALSKFPNPTVREYYSATIRVLLETHPSSGEETTKWVLIGLSSQKTFLCKVR